MVCFLQNPEHNSESFNRGRTKTSHWVGKTTIAAKYVRFECEKVWYQTKMHHEKVTK